MAHQTFTIGEPNHQDLFAGRRQTNFTWTAADSTTRVDSSLLEPDVTEARYIAYLRCRAGAIEPAQNFFNLRFRTATQENREGIDAGQDLSDQFGSNWELGLRFGDDLHIFRHGDFSADTGEPYTWRASDDATANAMNAARTAWEAYGSGAELVLWDGQGANPFETQVDLAASGNATGTGSVDMSIVPNPDANREEGSTIVFDSEAAFAAAFEGENIGSSDGHWRFYTSGSTGSSDTGPGSNNTLAFLGTETSVSSARIEEAEVAGIVRVASLPDETARRLRVRACIQGAFGQGNEGLEIQSRSSTAGAWTQIGFITGWGHSDDYVVGNTITDEAGASLTCVANGGWVDFEVDVPDAAVQVRLHPRYTWVSGTNAWQHDVALREMQWSWAGSAEADPVDLAAEGAATGTGAVTVGKVLSYVGLAASVAAGTGTASASVGVQAASVSHQTFTIGEPNHQDLSAGRRETNFTWTAADSTTQVDSSLLEPDVTEARYIAYLRCRAGSTVPGNHLFTLRFRTETQGNREGAEAGQDLSDTFEANWELGLRFGDDLHIFRHGDFSADAGEPYGWRASDDATANAVNAARTAWEAYGSGAELVLWDGQGASPWPPDPIGLSASATVGTGTGSATVGKQSSHVGIAASATAGTGTGSATVGKVGSAVALAASAAAGTGTAAATVGKQASHVSLSASATSTGTASAAVGKVDGAVSLPASATVGTGTGSVTVGVQAAPVGFLTFETTDGGVTEPSNSALLDIYFEPRIRVDSSVVADGVSDLYIDYARLWMRVDDSASGYRFDFSRSQTGAISTDRDMLAAWETLNPAIRFEIGDFTIEIPGPLNSEWDGVNTTAPYRGSVFGSTDALRTAIRQFVANVQSAPPADGIYRVEFIAPERVVEFAASATVGTGTGAVSVGKQTSLVGLSASATVGTGTASASVEVQEAAVSHRTFTIEVAPTSTTLRSPNRMNSQFRVADQADPFNDPKYRVPDGLLEPGSDEDRYLSLIVIRTWDDSSQARISVSFSDGLSDSPGDDLSGTFEANWEVGWWLGSELHRFRHDDFTSDSNDPYLWMTTDSGVVAAVEAARAAWEAHGADAQFTIWDGRGADPFAVFVDVAASATAAAVTGSATVSKQTSLVGLSASATAGTGTASVTVGSQSALVGISASATAGIGTGSVAFGKIGSLVNVSASATAGTGTGTVTVGKQAPTNVNVAASATVGAGTGAVTVGIQPAPVGSTVFEGGYTAETPDNSTLLDVTFSPRLLVDARLVDGTVQSLYIDFARLWMRTDLSMSGYRYDFSRSETGPISTERDLVEAWEQLNPAVRFTIGDLSVEVPGPTATGVWSFTNLTTPYRGGATRTDNQDLQTLIHDFNRDVARAAASGTARVELLVPDFTVSLSASATAGTGTASATVGKVSPITPLVDVAASATAGTGTGSVAVGKQDSRINLSASAASTATASVAVGKAGSLVGLSASATAGTGTAAAAVGKVGSSVAVAASATVGTGTGAAAVGRQGSHVGFAASAGAGTGTASATVGKQGSAVGLAASVEAGDASGQVAFGKQAGSVDLSARSQASTGTAQVAFGAVGSIVALAATNAGNPLQATATVDVVRVEGVSPRQPPAFGYPRGVSDAFRTALYAQATGEALAVLVTFTNELSDGTQTVRRVTDHPGGLTSGGHAYAHHPMQIRLPEARHNAAPRARLTIDNVDRTLLQALRFAISSRADVGLVLASAPDDVEVSWNGIEVGGLRWTVNSMNVDLTQPDGRREPYPVPASTPSTTPGAF